MHIVVGSDHAGYPLKQEVIRFLHAEGHRVEDVGTDSIESTDYPDYAVLVARAVAEGRADLGILICGTGIGMGIAANKVRGIRAAVATNSYMARKAREDNDANVLCLGGRVLGVGSALEIVRAFLATRFAGGRHASRVRKIAAIEREERE